MRLPVPLLATPLLTREGAIASAVVEGPVEESSQTRVMRASSWLCEQRQSLPIVTGPCTERGGEAAAVGWESRPSCMERGLSGQIFARSHLSAQGFFRPGGAIAGG